METYSVQEKNQCLKWYFSGNSVRQIRDLFSALYPNQRIPSISTIHGLIRKFNETGSIVKLCKKCSNLDNEENRINEERNDNKLNVLLRVTDNPNISVRQISKQLDLHPATVHKILKSEKFNSYKYTNHQEIFEFDKMARSEFCELIMDKSNMDRHFLKNICFTDESTFILHGEPNNQNHRYWSKDNPHPHVMLQTHTQYPQKINVWAGIFGSHIIGPFFIEGSLNSEKYLNLLENNIGPELEAHSNQNTIVWYQHDGCPAHYSQEVKVYLDDCFPESWIGRGGSINWPARSPDLTPCDFFLWPHLKEKVYSRQNDDLESLKNAIVDECNNITQRQLSAVRRNFYDRLGYCQAVDGDLFEHLL